MPTNWGFENDRLISQINAQTGESQWRQGQAAQGFADLPMRYAQGRGIMLQQQAMQQQMQMEGEKHQMQMQMDAAEIGSQELKKQTALQNIQFAKELHAASISKAQADMVMTQAKLAQLEYEKALKESEADREDFKVLLESANSTGPYKAEYDSTRRGIVVKERTPEEIQAQKDWELQKRAASRSTSISESELGKALQGLTIEKAITGDLTPRAKKAMEIRAKLRANPNDDQARQEAMDLIQSGAASSGPTGDVSAPAPASADALEPLVIQSMPEMFRNDPQAMKWARDQIPMIRKGYESAPQVVRDTWPNIEDFTRHYMSTKSQWYFGQWGQDGGR